MVYRGHPALLLTERVKSHSTGGTVKVVSVDDGTATGTPPLLLFKKTPALGTDLGTRKVLSLTLGALHVTPLFGISLDPLSLVVVVPLSALLSKTPENTLGIADDKLLQPGLKLFSRDDTPFVVLLQLLESIFDLPETVHRNRVTSPLDQG